MVISIIVAMGKKRVIGIKNSLPWNMPADLKHFKEMTKGKPVIMGMKTFESIGKALPGRINIVISHVSDYKAEGCIVVHSIEEALKAAEGHEEVMIAGGASIYKEFLPKADKMYLTLIDADFEGDAYFPEYKVEDWEEESYEEHERDKDNQFNYTFVVLRRKKQ